MDLKTLLDGNPQYDERLAEEVLEHFIRMRIRRLSLLAERLGDWEEVRQLLRIALWQVWARYREGGTTLYAWIMYNLDRRLMNLFAREAQRQRPDWEVLCGDMGYGFAGHCFSGEGGTDLCVDAGYSGDGDSAGYDATACQTDTITEVD